jgi:ribosomal protein L40E
MTEKATRQKIPTSTPPPETVREVQDHFGELVSRFAWLLPVAAIAAALAAGSLYGVGTAILVLAFGVLLIVITIFWSSVRTLSGETPITLEEAIALGSSTAAEEQKRAVLQALKDLEFERSVGKISDADYEDLVRRYRTEAKRLLRAVDEDLAPMRERAAAYVAEQLGTGRDGKATAAAKTAKSSKKVSVVVCVSCQADNDVDAVFCKKCGAKIDAAKDPHDATA